MNLYGRVQILKVKRSVRDLPKFCCSEERQRFILHVFGIRIGRLGIQGISWGFNVNCLVIERRVTSCSTGLSVPAVSMVGGVRRWTISNVLRGGLGRKVLDSWRWWSLAASWLVTHSCQAWWPCNRLNVQPHLLYNQLSLNGHLELVSTFCYYF